MVKNNWTIDDIINTLDKVEKIYNKTDDMELKKDCLKDIQNINNWLSNHNIELSDTSYLKLYDNLKERIFNLYPFWGNIRDFSINTSNSLEEVNLKTNSFSKKDILDLTYDFYHHNLDKFFCSKFMKNFKNRYDHTRFIKNNISSNTLHIISTNEKYIEISRDFSYRDLLNTIHEYMHATSYSINPNHSSEEKSYFNNVDSLLTELIATDYFENIFKDGKMQNIKINTQKHFSDLSKYLDKSIKLVNKELLANPYYNNKKLRLEANKCGLNDEELIYILNTFEDKELISYIYSIEFYKFYTEDREKCMDYLRKFIFLTCESKEEYYEKMKSLRIIPNVNSFTYQENINKLVRKRD